MPIQRVPMNWGWIFSLRAWWVAGLMVALPAHAVLDREKQLEVGSAVVKIEAVSPEGGFGLGSGVIVAPGQVVTNCHVTRRAARLYVLKHGTRSLARSQRTDIYRDLCLITVPDLEGEPVPLGQTSGLRRGDGVMAIGYTGGLGIQHSVGEVVALHRLAGSRVLQTNNWFSSGASGGGLFNGRGELIGILTFRLRGGERHYYTVPVEWVRELLAARGADQPVAPVAGLCFWELGPEEQPHFLRATALAQGQAWGDLVDLAERWQREDPEDGEAPHALGLGLQGLGRWPDAEGALQRALKLDPHNLRAWGDLGRLYKRTGREQQARALLATLHRQDPAAAQALSRSLETP